jgi:diaminohydroxyphosphoribosylaminopyrimidine deaminase/5-amino-6-(5-phosphoribosylamino)uracil reductase
MQTALALAASAGTLTGANPRVGCVLVNTQGQVIGQGHTQQTGGPHAEIMALRDAQSAGHSTVGCTAYVTLEPCSHHGRTGPCCDALIAAGVAKVVASIEDPNPLVQGAGIKRLQAAGVTVEVGDGATESRELNIGFFSRMIRHKPWVRLKVAASIDGKTALENGVSQWITSPQARADGHAWRARANALLTGIGTVLDDSPRMDVRLVAATRQPPLVVVDSRLQTPTDAPLFDAERPVYIYYAVPDSGRQQSLESAGAQLIHLPGMQDDGTSTGKVDLAALLKDLAAKEINELHIEAGHKLNGSLLREGLVDELLVYLAPKLMGRGAAMADFGPFTRLDQAPELEFLSTQMVGPDLRIVARIAGQDHF